MALIPTDLLALATGAQTPNGEAGLVPPHHGVSSQTNSPGADLTERARHLFGRGEAA